MTPFSTFMVGSAAALLLAAGASPLAARAQADIAPPVHLVCSGGQADAFCQALAGAFRAERPGRDVVLAGPAARIERGAEVLRFVAEARSEDRLAGHLEWQAKEGRRVVGPRLELQAMDSPLTRPMFDSFAGELLRFSRLPL